MKRITAIILFAAILFTGVFFTGCSKSYDKFLILDENFGSEQYGIGFRQNDVAFGLEVQRIMDEMNDDGTSGELCKKWFAGEDIILKDGDWVEPDATVQPGDTSLEDIKAKGKFIVGLDDSFPPMGFRDEDNNIVGLDIDLAKEVASRMGVEVEFQPIDWDAKELELQSGNIDMIWNGMTINQERIDNMYFAKPYLDNKQIIIVPEGSDIESKADLADKVIGLQKGSSSLEAFNKDAAVAASVKEVVEFADNVTAFMDLKAGRIDAFVVDEVAGRYIIENN